MYLHESDSVTGDRTLPLRTAGPGEEYSLNGCWNISEVSMFVTWSFSWLRPKGLRQWEYELITFT